MQTGRNAFAVLEARQTVVGPIEICRETAARLADGPVEKRVVTSEEDVGAVQRRRRTAGFRMIDPRPDFSGGKQELAGGPRTGNFSRGREVIDLALLDPQELGQFLDRQKLVSVGASLGHFIPSSARYLAGTAGKA